MLGLYCVVSRTGTEYLSVIVGCEFYVGYCALCWTGTVKVAESVDSGCYDV